ncbi:fused MFS/spermidine synthase [Stenotrophomonas aracearum]|uniref:Fused MFS/spermidine synthase n=1 Tax=Stenotrophomonas aracearum TaxID=3003272 RepID=A0ABY9YAS4_9GAMM|nr:fused MFS/spermidine synthase [Stenotrophomonas sp. A5588]WNH47957.1 fused MFS/spermidine synthase [Stenotrophomonas sp. A5588]
MNSEKSRSGTLLLWVFVLSGFSGLIYQSIWTQYLGLFLGHSSYAQSLVLLLFMGGMAAGAWLVSRRSVNLKRPLLAYAAIELVIGLLGLAFDPLFQGATQWAYTSVFPAMGGSGVNWVRWGMATLLVLPQCVLLGATFPLMSAGFMRLQPHAEGRVLAGLYFSNSIGAAAGALASTYLLLPWVGLPGTIMSAGLLNILIAIAVYPLSKMERESAIAEMPASVDSGRGPLFILIVAGLTGASSFVYEITWVRMLSLALGTTIHAFELMLASFIAGIAFGGLWLRSRADRLASPLVTAGWVQVWMGLAALASMFVYANSFEWVGWLMRVIVRNAEGYGLYNLASGLISLLVMFPAAFFAGMTLPLLTLALLRQGQGEKAIGQVYAFNTLGAIVGVLATVHLLLPMLGLKLALAAAAAVDLLLGVVLLRRYSLQVGGRIPPSGKALILSAIGMACALLFVRFDPLMLTSSVYRHGRVSLAEDAKMLYLKDGKTATVAVYEVPNHGELKGQVRSIATNGKVDAGMAATFAQSPTTDESTMVILAALPMAMKESYERVGVIGFGSGLTTHTLMGSPRIGRVDTVEIEPAMVEGARHFGPRVQRAFDDTRSHIVIDDAKSYFSSSPAHYDLIISEPSNPWMGGTASLFSKEFYAFVPRQLNSDGLFVQWLQLYEIDPELVSSVLTGMLANFNDVHAYLANDSDLILVASPRGKVPRLEGSVFSDPLLKADLERVGVHGVRDMQDGFVMDKRALLAYVSQYPARANSDFFPILQLKAPESRFRGANVAEFGAFASAPWPVARHLGAIAAREEAAQGEVDGLPLATVRKWQSAKELKGVLMGHPSDGEGVANAGERLNAEVLRARAQSCSLDADPESSASLIISVAMETVPYLDAPGQSELWDRPAWLSCVPGDPLVQNALALVGAASQDRHDEVIEAGTRILDGPSAKFAFGNAMVSYYVVGAVQYAALASQRADVAKQAHERYDPLLQPLVRNSSPLRILTHMAAQP